MKYTLVPESSGALTEPCPPVTFEDDAEERQRAIDEMIGIMLEGGGIGLAAPQVGVIQRVFVMLTRNGPIACFNPEVVSASSETSRDYEGCLSFPDLFLLVDRAVKIQVKYQDVNAAVVTAELEGIEARCFLHELDHLNGTCFIKKVGPLALKMAQKRRNKNESIHCQSIRVC